MPSVSTTDRDVPKEIVSHGVFALANHVDLAYEPIGTLLDLPELQLATVLGRTEQWFPFTGDQRIDKKPEFVYQPCDR